MNPLKLTVVTAAALLLWAGCKKPQPSEDFTQASQSFATLYGQKLDDAYADPAMNPILEQLRRVPEGSADAAAAKELIGRIETGRAKVLADRAEREKLVDAARQPTLAPSFPSAEAQPPPAEAPPPPPPAQEAEDAGPNVAIAPRPGMTAAEFDKSFGDCFEFGPTIFLEGAGKGAADSRVLKDLNRCKDKLPGYDQKYVLFQNGVVVNALDKAAIKQVTTSGDGGIVDGAR